MPQREPFFLAASACLAVTSAPFSSSVINVLSSANVLAQLNAAVTIASLVTLPSQKSAAAFAAVRLSKPIADWSA